MGKFKNGDIVICKDTFGPKPLVFIGVAENLAYENDCVVLYNDSCIPIQLKNLTKLSESACFSSVGEDDAAVHAINSHDAMAKRIKEADKYSQLMKIDNLAKTHEVHNLKALLSEMDVYLNSGLGPNFIATGSIFHEQIKEALKEQG